VSSPDTTPFLIVPLIGDTEPIELVASALPLQGVTFPTEQRIKTTYYPGNPVATQTVTGPTKGSTTVTGRWMDLTLGDGGTRLLIRNIEYLCERAIPVEVSWGGRSTMLGEDPAIVRQGLIKKFEPKYHRTIHAEWSIEFEWRGEALQTKPPTFAANLSPGNDLVAFSDALTENQDQTQSWIDTAWSIIGKGANAMLVVSDALDEVQNAVADATLVVNGASDMLQQIAQLPSDVIDRVRGMCDSVVWSCWNARAAYDCYVGLWAGIQKPRSYDSPWRAEAEEFGRQVKTAKMAFYPTDDPLSRLDQQTAEYALVRGWDSTAGQAAQIASEFAAKQVPDVIAVIRPPAGADLRDYALKYYGDPDNWIVIADYNGLDSSEVPATPTGPSEWGAPPIYVPRLTAQNAALVWQDP